MNLQNHSKHFKVQNEESTTSHTQTISLITLTRMQHIWITFIDGVKVLKEICLCLNEPIFDKRRLQELSKYAQEKIMLAEQDIDSGENHIKHEINLNLLERQENEKDQIDLSSNIESLSRETSSKEEEVQEATSQVKMAERQVKKHTTREFHAQIKNALVTGGTNLLTWTTVNAIGPTVGILAAEIGRLTTAVTYSNLQKVQEAAGETRIELLEKKNMLTEIKAALNRIIEEREEKKITLNVLENNHKKLLNELKLLTKQKSCISQCHDYINITLGRVEILNERRKIKILILNLKHSIERIIEHLSCVQFMEGHFPIMQQLKCLTLEIHSLCIRNSEQPYVYFEGCYCSYCCIGFFLSSFPCSCFRFRRLRL